ncbi:MAG: hypothetical protein KTR14_09310 [Vampirovibrio sp.]|nr:hypothetical protein [Vampirovibrio sp.]
MPIRNCLRRRAQPVEGTDASATKEVSARQSSDAPEDPKQAIRTASVQHARKFDFDRKREREAWTELTGDDKTEKFSFHTDPRIRDIPLIDLPKRSASTGKGEVNRTREFLQKKIEEMTQRLHNAEPGTESYLNIQEKRRQLRILKYNAATRVTRQKRYRKGSKPFAHPKGISVHERERRKVLNSLTEEYRARATRLMAAHDEKIHALRVEGSVTADRKERNRIGRQIKTLRRLRATAPQRIADTVPYATKKARLLPAVTPGQRAAKRAATGRNPLIWRDAEKALEKSAALRQQAKTLSDSKPDHWAVPEGRDRYRTERGVHARVLKIYRSVGDRESAWHASSRIPVEMYAPGSRETHKKERQGLAIKLRKTRARAQAINQGSLKGP